MPFYRIHPAIGIARVGNSPEYFIGPESRYQPDPPGGYKDASCRIRRQAARFRIFRYPDNPNKEPIEIDLRRFGTRVRWRVGYEGSRVKQLSGGPPTTFPPPPPAPGVRLTRSDGVYLGGLQLDEGNRLLVLPGLGHIATTNANAAGDDDLWDGYVDATVTIDGVDHVAARARIVVAPPSFAPQLRNIVTLWDLKEDQIHSALGSPLGPVTYAEHILPILRAAKALTWVRADARGAEGWDLNDVSSLDRDEIFAFIGGRVTALQRARLDAFFSVPHGPDEPGEDDLPEVLPFRFSADELDRAALETCTGRPFAQGLEVNNKYTEYDSCWTGDARMRRRLRDDHAVGFLRSGLYKPWAADVMYLCSGYWPIAAPARVRTSSASDAYTPFFESGAVPNTLEGLHSWARHGFVLEDARSGQYLLRNCPAFDRWDLEPPPRRDWFVPPWRDWMRSAAAIAERIAGAQDPLPRTLRELDALPDGELRVQAVELRAKITRLEAALQLIEARLDDDATPHRDPQR